VKKNSLFLILLFLKFLKEKNEYVAVKKITIAFIIVSGYQWLPVSEKLYVGPGLGSIMFTKCIDNAANLSKSDNLGEVWEMSP
jgi:hypothetical protein